MSDPIIPSVVETQSLTVKFQEGEKEILVLFEFSPGKPDEARIFFQKGSPTPRQMQQALQSFCERFPEVFQ